MAEHNQGEPKTVEEQEELIKSQADSDCIFCKIIKGSIPCFKIFENSTTLAFFDINPISSGHALVIPKYHGPKLHQMPDFAIQDILPTAKKIAIELGLTDYNILQNKLRAIYDVFNITIWLLGNAFLVESLTKRWITFISILIVTIEHMPSQRHVIQNMKSKVIPKPSATDSEGLVIGWPSKKADMETLGQKAKALQAKLDNQSTSNTSYL
ncbi:hypothetical protein PSTT_08140 [Puccinia striiformis]|uniref:HIT domain-containing protein n=1 Tax=Puccinia striiformis TaxID=27350 RepID=A0A2S4VDU1_9BASI|nr:hypothetical protein PSTT_08140 [Puccinia striiformis]